MTNIRCCGRWGTMVLCGILLSADCAPADAAENAKSAARTPMLMSVGDVAELVAGSDPCILLGCQDKADYQRGHLDGARWVDVARWKTLALSDGGGGLENRGQWSKFGSELGLTRDARIVVYGGPLPNAARIWWLLKYLGCRNVSLMDGGIDAWRKAELPLTDAVADVVASEFEPDFQKQRLARIDGVKQSIKEGKMLVFDTRSREEFSAGRVPGAVHIEWLELVRPNGTFKPAAELRAMFERAKMNPERTAVTYCRSGGRASVEAFALELAGYENVKNYFCSWQEYSSDDEAPIEK